MELIETGSRGRSLRPRMMRSSSWATTSVARPFRGASAQAWEDTETLFDPATIADEFKGLSCQPGSLGARLVA